MALEGLGDRTDRRRQHAAEVGMALGEAEPKATGGGRSPDRQALALGERDRDVPRTARVDVGAGDEDWAARRSEAIGKRAHRLGVGGGAAVDRPPDRLASVGLRDLCYQSSIGTETKTGPRGGSEARCAARARASGTSWARGGS